VKPERISRLLLLLAGFALLAAALVYNELLLGLVIKPGKFGPARVAGVRSGQLVLLAAGGILLLAAGLVQRVPIAARLFARPAAPTLLMILLALALPVFIAEVVLRPFAKLDPLTTLYARDPELGWRQQPGTHRWSGASITINAKGLRGAELPYPKPPGSLRILWLGDSVLVGDRIANDDLIFPEQVGRRLAERRAAPVETVNAGVSGYSPWQEAAWLEKEGLRYAPDLVVVVFVLNDVTERLELVRFGGYWEGWQLGHTSSSRLAHWLRQSSTVFFARKLAGLARYGADAQAGARDAELLEVRELAERPDDPRVREAWSATLAELDRILDIGKAHGIPVAMVVSPFAFQLAEPSLPAAPQERIASWAQERGVPILDLLPLLRAAQRDQQLRPEDLFLDHCHFTEAGHARVAAWMADWLASMPLDTR
jgi:lysophospholipase L1-like esterase